MINIKDSAFILTRFCRDNKLLVLVFFFLISFFQSSSQTCVSKINWQPENEVNFYTYPLLPNKIGGITQDKYGYIWIGSKDGLYRFDGVSYKRYAHSDSDSNTIGSNECWPAFIDSRGIMWLGTSTGLSILNTSTYKFHNYPFSDSLFSDVITGAKEDAAHNVWISSFGKKNLAKYEPTKNKFTAYSVPDSLYGKGMRTFGFTLNPDGKIYIAGDNGVLVFNPQTEKYEKRIPIACHLMPPFNGGLAQCILSDSKGDIYVGTWNGEGRIEIEKYDRNRQCMEWVYDNPQLKKSVVYFLEEKSNTELWVGTDNGGLLIYNKETRQCQSCIHKTDDPLSFPGDMNGAAGIFKDRAGCFWFSLNNKLIKAEPIDQLVKSYNLKKLFGVNDPGFNIVGVKKLSAENKILVSTYSGEGFYELNLNNNELKKNTVTGSYEKTWNELDEVVRTKNGQYWSHNNYQILHYDSLSGKWAVCQTHTTIHDNFSIVSMMEDSHGHLWFGTFTHGVYDFNPEDNSCINYPKKSYNTTYPKPDFMKPSFEDEQENIWMVSFDGVYLFNLKNKTFTRVSYKNGDKNYNDGRALLKDKSGNIWRTTPHGGFQKFNSSTNMFEVISADIDTKPIRMYDMVEDNRGYIWVSSDEYICRFDPRTNTFLIPKQSMNMEMGSGIVGFCKEDGTLYTSTSGMLYETNTNLFRGNPEPPQIVFNSFKVLNRDTIFSQNLNDLSDITLPYNLNFISIEFAALNFSHSEKNLYAYKLDGIDKDWVMNGNKSAASYSNLAPGRYVFHAKSCNNTGVWNETGKNIAIVILPPWWQTWWFRLIVICVILTAVWFALREYTLRKLKHQKIEMEKHQRVLEERTRIASELHDDLGSGLTKISMMSQMAGNMKDEKQLQTLNKITNESSEMVDRMNGIIWALNTKNDSLPNLISFIRKHAFELFEESAIKLVWDADDVIPEIPITGEVRRNIYLVVKEALHNALKYSFAEEVKVKVNVKEEKLEISIQDNGKGFDIIAMNTNGNGLQNMKKRMNELQGNLNISSEINKGTTVLISYSFKHYTKV